ncbi:MAG: hypothetical protein ACYCW6_07760 [Candidatus Xenobia bacterium]
MFHHSLESMGREWLGLLLMQRFFEAQGIPVQDVHQHSRDHDLIVAGRTVDAKIDFYFGAEDVHEFHRRRTGFAALETVSNDVLGTMGWMVTTEADAICYYFLALEHPADEVRRWIEQRDPTVVLRDLRAWDDCLLVLPVPALRAWFWGGKRYLNFRHCRIPNIDGDGRVYHTWVRLAPVEALAALPGARVYNRISRIMAG